MRFVLGMRLYLSAVAGLVLPWCEGSWGHVRWCYHHVVPRLGS